MTTFNRRVRLALAALLIVLAGLPARADDAAEGLRALEKVYATQPHGYPAGRGDAQPDTSVPFRWHGYGEDAIPRCEDARVDVHAEPYNPLEDAGVSADKPVRFEFVAEHVTSGRKALRAEF